MDDTITAAVPAELIGVSDRTVRDFAKRQIITRAGKGYVLADRP
jgi:hypothetical protein